MALDFDAQGFLKGDPIDLGRLPGYMRDIKSDVAAIKRAVIGGNQAAKKVAETKPAAPVVRNMPKRDSSVKFTASPIGGHKSSPEVAALANRLRGLGSIGAGASDVDPSIKAFREVAEPMQRGVEFFKGGKNSAETKWLRKIFSKLNIFQRESSTSDKAQLKTLKQIDEKQSGSGAFANPSSSFIDKIPVIGTLARAFGKTAIGGGMLGMLAKGGRGAAGILKRIPILGTLLAGAGAAFDIYGSENSDMSRRQKDAAAGKSLGGWGGTIAGVAAGAAAGALAGPVGMVVGGVVGGFLGDQAGQIIGEKFGQWVSDLREADVPGRLVSAFDKWTGGFDFSKGFELWWERTKGNFDQVGAVAAEQLDGLNSYVKGNTGIDFKDMGAQWWDRTKKNVSDVWNTASGVPAWMMDNSTIGKSFKAVKNLRTGGEIGSAEQAMQLLMQMGWSKDDAAAIAANLNSESGFDTSASGDNNTAIGVAQWHKDRQDVFKEKYGKNIADASFEEQMRFVDWELRNTHKRAGDNIRAAKTVEQKAAIGEQQYEISALGQRGGVQPERIADARKYASIAYATAPMPSAPKIPSMPAIAEAPQIVQPLGSQKSQQVTVNIPSQDAGRDISDRRMAHIVTGGVGGG